MIALAKRLIALNSLKGSRYKSLYTYLSLKDHENLVSLAHDLYYQNQGKLYVMVNTEVNFVLLRIEKGAETCDKYRRAPK